MVVALRRRRSPTSQSASVDRPTEAVSSWSEQGRFYPLSLLPRKWGANKANMSSAFTAGGRRGGAGEACGSLWGVVLGGGWSQWRDEHAAKTPHALNNSKPSAVRCTAARLVLSTSFSFFLVVARTSRGRLCRLVYGGSCVCMRKLWPVRRRGGIVRSQRTQRRPNEDLEDKRSARISLRRLLACVCLFGWLVLFSAGFFFGGQKAPADGDGVDNLKYVVPMGAEGWPGSSWDSLGWVDLGWVGMLLWKSGGE